MQDYARRWQIKMALRFNKSELAIDSPRVWSWERRLKLLMIVTLVYAFLLRLLCEPQSLDTANAKTLLPPNRKAEPGNPDSALSTTSSALSALARSSATLSFI